MHNIFRALVLAAVTTLVIASCSKTGSKPAVTPPTDTTKTTTTTTPHDSVTDVYVAGGLTNLPVHHALLLEERYRGGPQ